MDKIELFELFSPANNFTFPAQNSRGGDYVPIGEIDNMLRGSPLFFKTEYGKILEYITECQKIDPDAQIGFHIGLDNNEPCLCIICYAKNGNRILHNGSDAIEHIKPPTRAEHKHTGKK